MSAVKVFKRDENWKIKFLSLTKEEQLTLIVTLTYRLSFGSSIDIFHLIFNSYNDWPHTSFNTSGLPKLYEYVFMLDPDHYVSSWKDSRGIGTFYSSLVTLGKNHLIVGEKHEVDYSSVIDSKSKFIVR